MNENQYKYIHINSVTVNWHFIIIHLDSGSLCIHILELYNIKHIVLCILC